MATKYFMAGGVDSDWSGDDNWSTTSSAGPNNTTHAVAGDDVILDSGSPACTVDATSACATVNTTGYASTVTQTSALTLTGLATLAAGIWSGAGNFTCGGLTVSGATVTMGGTTDINGDFNCSSGSITLTSGTTYILEDCIGTFTHNSGTIEFDNYGQSGATIVINSSSIFNNVTFKGTNYSNASYSLSQDMDVDGTLLLQKGNNYIVLNNNKIYASGTVTRATTVSCSLLGTTNIVLNGTQSVNFGGTNITNWIQCPITINSGGTVTFTNNAHHLSSITYTTGTVAWGTSELVIGNTGTVNLQNQSVYKLTFGRVGTAVTTLSSDITVTNLLSTSGTAGFTVNGYIIHAQNDVHWGSVSCGTTNGTTKIEISGSGNQSVYFQCDPGSYYNYLPVDIKSTGGTVTFTNVVHELDGNLSFVSGTVSMGTGTLNYTLGTITYTAGTIDATSLTLQIKNTCSLNTNGMNWNNITFAAGTYTVTLSSALTLIGNWTRTGSVTWSGNLIVTFAGTSTLSGATTFYNLTINPDAIVHLTTGQNFIVSNIASINGTSGHNVIIDSVTPDTKATLKITNGLRNAAYITATDIDSSSGKPILGRNLTLDNTTNWANYVATFKRWTGAEWVKAKCNRYTGAAFVSACPRFYDGDSWEYIETDS